MIEVLIAVEGPKCIVCQSMSLIYKVTIGDLSLYLCEDCATELYSEIESEVIVPDVREW